MNALCIFGDICAINFMLEKRPLHSVGVGAMNVILHTFYIYGVQPTC